MDASTAARYLIPIFAFLASIGSAIVLLRSRGSGAKVASSSEATRSGAAHEAVGASPQSAAETCRDEEPQRRESEKAVSWHQIAAAWVSAAGTIVALAGLIFTLQETRRATEASLETYQLSLQSLKLGHRAFLEVTILPPEGRLIPDFTAHPVRGVNQFRAVVRNTGNSKASWISPIVLTHGVKRPGKPARFFDEAPVGIAQGGTLYPGNGSQVMAADVHLRPDEVAAIEDAPDSQRWILYVYGTLRYFDGFDCKRAWFCRSYIPSRLRPDEDFDMGGCVVRQDDNEVDEPLVNCTNDSACRNDESEPE